VCALECSAIGLSPSGPAAHQSKGVEADQVPLNWYEIGICDLPRTLSVDVINAGPA